MIFGLIFVAVAFVAVAYRVNQLDDRITSLEKLLRQKGA